MFDLMKLITIIAGCSIGYVLGYYYHITPWERKYCNEAEREIPFVFIRKRNYYNICLILLVVNSFLYFLVDISIHKSADELDLFARVIIIILLYYLSIVLASILFAKKAAKRDKEKYFPTGELIAESFSPLKSYKITAWKVWGNYVRCEILKISYNTTRTIYFNACDDVSIEWLDNDTIVINGEELNAETGVYDARIHPLRSGLQ